MTTSYAEGYKHAETGGLCLSPYTAGTDDHFEWMNGYRACWDDMDFYDRMKRHSVIQDQGRAGSDGSCG